MPKVTTIPSQVTPNTQVQEQKKVNRGIINDVARGIINSRTFLALAVITCIVVPVCLLVSNPAGWLIATAVVSGFAISLLLRPSARIIQEFVFEFSVFGRMLDLFGPKWNEIIVADPKQKEVLSLFGRKTLGKLYLGGIPNRLTSYGERLANELKIKHVMSVNESWEREPMGLSIPYTKQDYQDLGIDFHPIDVVDLNIPTNKQLHDAADFIHNNLSKGENVYVHCKAGMGRSASTIAAYFIKYHHMSPKDAAIYVKHNRPVSLVKEKDLINFYNDCYPKK